jgi:putative ABC transport system permease protein
MITWPVLFVPLINIDILRNYFINAIRQFRKGRAFSRIDPRALNVFSIKMQPDQINKTIAAVHNEWDAWFPERNFEYEFLDKGLNDQYQKEEKLGTTIRYFAGLAVFVSCLCLLGLVALIVRQRNKEIGIRKVLGASTGGIIALTIKAALANPLRSLRSE